MVRTIFWQHLRLFQTITINERENFQTFRKVETSDTRTH